MEKIVSIQGSLFHAVLTPIKFEHKIDFRTIVAQEIVITNEMIGKLKEFIENNGLNLSARHIEKVTLRNILYTRLRDYGLTLEIIGGFFNKNHATVLHGIRKYEIMKETKDFLLNTIEKKYEVEINNIFNDESK